MQLWHLWIARGHLREGRRWLELALSANAEYPPAMRAQALAWLGWWGQLLGEPSRSRELYEESLAIRRTLGNGGQIADSLWFLGTDAGYRRVHAEAVSYLEEALSLWREAGLPFGVTIALNALAIVRRALGDYAAAEALLREGAALARQAGKTDREIAAALVISENTVGRHLLNVFTKLGVTTRTAAARHAPI